MICHTPVDVRKGIDGLWESDLAVEIPTVFTWNGSVSSNWNHPANWSDHGVPSLRQDVVIADGVAPHFDPVVNVPGLGSKDLTLQPGANMMVPDGILFETKHH